MRDRTVTFPRSIDDLSPPWLTSRLRETGAIDHRTSVLAAESTPLAEGLGMLSHIHRLDLALDGPGPASAVAKLPTTTPYRQLADATGAYAREVQFYDAVGPEAPLRTAKVYAAMHDAETDDFVLLLEDLGHLEAADHLVGLTFERAAKVIDDLAKFHAWAWGLGHASTRHDAFAPIDGPVTVGLYTMGIANGWSVYAANSRTEPPAGLDTFVAAYVDRVPALLAALSSPPTLLNGDLRADNLFFDDAGTPTTVDFQLVMRGAGIWDVAYLIGQGLTPQERAGRERELVSRYLDGLASGGVSDYHADQAWHQFRIATAVQVTFPLTAMLSWETLGERARELVLTLAERSFAIIDDAAALAACDQVSN